jgi:hypothetical protein
MGAVGAAQSGHIRAVVYDKKAAGLMHALCQGGASFEVRASPSLLVAILDYTDAACKQRVCEIQRVIARPAAWRKKARVDNGVERRLAKGLL